MAVVIASSCARTLPPLGQALIVIDTDLTVPRLVDRVRIDLYTADRRWYLAREIPAFKPSDWPLSFGVYLEEGRPATSVIVRVRGYLQSAVRDYHGERFIDRTTAVHNSPFIRPDPFTEQPRLFDPGGVDVTPRLEPEPLLAIDRLVLVHLEPRVTGAVPIVLRGRCAGVMADLSGSRTCVDQELELRPLVASTLEPSAPSGSLQGSFEAPWAGKDCAAKPRAAHQDLFDDEVCVPGGVFVFGSGDFHAGSKFDDLPQRLAIVPSFFMDKFEVTVARYRDAIARGFSGGKPVANDGPLPEPHVNGVRTDPEGPDLCTWTDAPAERERYPVNCVAPSAARAFCKWSGGDLPLEVQWEFAAGAAMRPAKTHFAWGDEPIQPSCADVTYYRTNLVAEPCGFGPAPITHRATGDVSIGLGLVDLGGSMFEITNDAGVSMSSDCWLGAPLELPTCGAKVDELISRGGSWLSNYRALVAASRGQEPRGGSTSDGFRCVRRGDAP